MSEKTLGEILYETNRNQGGFQRFFLPWEQISEVHKEWEALAETFAAEVRKESETAFEKERNDWNNREINWQRQDEIRCKNLEDQRKEIERLHHDVLQCQFLIEKLKSELAAEKKAYTDAVEFLEAANKEREVLKSQLAAQPKPRFKVGDVAWVASEDRQALLSLKVEGNQIGVMTPEGIHKQEMLLTTEEAVEWIKAKGKV